ncbi:hypothetical protein D3C81_1441870 [compost metagenome]
MTVRTHRQHRPQQIEFENFHIHRRFLEHIGDRSNTLLQQSNGGLVIRRAGELGLQFHPAERVVAVILDVVAEDLVVTDQGQHVVRGIDRRGEQTDFLHHAGHAASGDDVANLERSQHDDETTGCQIGQQTGPGHADGQADRRDQGGQAGGLDAEVAEDADHQQDVQGNGDERSHVAQYRRVYILSRQPLLYQPHGEADQPASDDPEGNRCENLDAEGHCILRNGIPQGVDLFRTDVDDGRFVHGGSPSELRSPQKS